MVASSAEAQAYLEPAVHLHTCVRSCNISTGYQASLLEEGTQQHPGMQFPGCFHPDRALKEGQLLLSVPAPVSLDSGVPASLQEGKGLQEMFMTYSFTKQDKLLFILLIAFLMRFFMVLQPLNTSHQQNMSLRWGYMTICQTSQPSEEMEVWQTALHIQ